MSLVKPNLETHFHIDFDWWKNNENDWHIHLRSLLCAEHREKFLDVPAGAMTDYIDPDTAEVYQMGALQQVILSHCSHQPDFVTHQTQLVEGVFRIFLANGNTPLNSLELADKLGRPANTILITLTGPRVYKGIRPLN